MERIVPGTTLMADRHKPEAIEAQLRGMFLGGDIALGQVTRITGLEPYMVQNWVKRGYLPAPVGRKYSLVQLCRILNINMLKDVLTMEQICGLLTYVNGCLSDTSDDLIDDAHLYFLFLRLVAQIQDLTTPESREKAVKEVLSDYQEPAPGAAERVGKVLRVMITAWSAAALLQRTNALLNTIKED